MSNNSTASRTWTPKRIHADDVKPGDCISVNGTDLIVEEAVMCHGGQRVRYVCEVVGSANEWVFISVSDYVVRWTPEASQANTYRFAKGTSQAVLEALIDCAERHACSKRELGHLRNFARYAACDHVVLKALADEASPTQ